MDWIESLFGISPDGGSGATEMLVVASLAMLAAAVISRRRLLSLYREITAKRGAR